MAFCGARGKSVGQTYSKGSTGEIFFYGYEILKRRQDKIAKLLGTGQKLLNNKLPPNKSMSPPVDLSLLLHPFSPRKPLQLSCVVTLHITTTVMMDFYQLASLVD